MLYDTWFKNPKDVPVLLEKIKKYSDKTGSIRLMEICGTHTMAIARSGIRSILPENVHLLSGPGCPVCVTPSNVIDMILSLSQEPDIRITTYGDLLRVPGSTRGDSLLSRRSTGGKVESVYSPTEAVRIAEEHPETEVIFLGVGFETTAPGTAACILDAASRGLKNFSVLCLLKRTEPAIRSLIESDDFAVNGFICPGHVAAIIGANGFSFLPDDYRLPGVVAGFEPADLVYSILEQSTGAEERIYPARPAERQSCCTRSYGKGILPCRIGLARAWLYPGQQLCYPGRIRAVGCSKEILLDPAQGQRNPGMSVRPDHTGRHAAPGVPSIPKGLFSG